MTLIHSFLSKWMIYLRWVWKERLPFDLPEKVLWSHLLFEDIIFLSYMHIVELHSLTRNAYILSICLYCNDLLSQKGHSALSSFPFDFSISLCRSTIETTYWLQGLCFGSMESSKLQTNFGQETPKGSSVATYERLFLLESFSVSHQQWTDPTRDDNTNSNFRV
jgi:hypothetical protein